jgi:hypothetical protein
MYRASPERKSGKRWQHPWGLAVGETVMRSVLNTFFGSLVALAVMLPTHAGAAAHSMEWRAFLKNPTVTTYNKLSAVLRPTAEQPCQGSDVTDRDVTLLEDLIEAKSDYAIRIGFAILPCQDGGNFEDVARELARLTDSDPTLLLRLSAKAGFQDRTLSYLVLMLPESTVDDVDAQEVWTGQRIEKVSSVTDPELQGIKKRALAILTAEFTRYETDWKDVDRTPPERKPRCPPPPLSHR